MWSVLVCASWVGDTWFAEGHQFSSVVVTYYAPSSFCNGRKYHQHCEAQDLLSHGAGLDWPGRRVKTTNLKSL